MRIAYIAPYQGGDLLLRRPCADNLSLAARVKIQLIAQLLQSSSHKVEILSAGTVATREFRFYKGFSERQLFDPDISIDYASALPIRFLRGFWEGTSVLNILRARHEQRPYDVVVVYGMGSAQIRCATYALRRRIPVVLEYEDDVFVDVHGVAGEGLGSKRPRSGLIWRHHNQVCRNLLDSVSAVIAPSPYLLAQCPAHIPKLLVRSVVSADIQKLRASKEPKKKWVVFSGTHERTQGLEQMIKAWRMLQIPDWELHIAGQGPLTPTLETAANGDKSIVFCGFLNLEQNARLLCAARIGMNAQDVTRVPGSVFAFKIVEYLAAGAHVITTPRGTLEPELETGVTYIPENSAETIAACLRDVILNSRYEHTAEHAAISTYGMAPMSGSLNQLLDQLTASAKTDAAKECQPA